MTRKRFAFVDHSFTPDTQAPVLRVMKCRCGAHSANATDPNVVSDWAVAHFRRTGHDQYTETVERAYAFVATAQPVG
ncbi:MULTISPECIES: DUF7848 domain-containing protein [unclassified Streptomyces]|uniref:DUF7848 domain-containing protein n=1 Tax=unclassified Streptomyces TaxID=2593676 RepID=UPI000DAE31E6|nr:MULTISPECIES: hypothetical protein [unclassified Streptomyces]PZT77385.1 hypothetical protein DNK56_29770 [Streptomyces sp. AC1-42W]PZT78660.1 hypothetical protein DNK55_02910 [Streptomyces sp. AC1-42T]